MQSRAEPIETWDLNGETIYRIGPLEEYLTALGLARRRPDWYRRLVVITGEPGTGKSVGAALFVRAMKGKARYLVIPPAQILRARSLMELFAQASGVATRPLRSYDFGQEIARCSREHPRILILDDAQRLTKGDFLDFIRWLIDAGGHTFILLGLPELEYVLSKKSEIADRVGFHHTLRLPTPAEIEPLFPGILPEVIEEIHAQAHGRMREVIALRQSLTDLLGRGKLDALELTPRQVQLVARHSLMGAA